MKRTPIVLGVVLGLAFACTKEPDRGDMNRPGRIGMQNENGAQFAPPPASPVRRLSSVHDGEMVFDSQHPGPDPALAASHRPVATVLRDGDLARVRVSVNPESDPNNRGDRVQWVELRAPDGRVISHEDCPPSQTADRTFDIAANTPRVDAYVHFQSGATWATPLPIEPSAPSRALGGGPTSR